MSFTNACLCAAVLTMCGVIVYLKIQIEHAMDVLAKQALKISQHDSEIELIVYEKNKMLSAVAGCEEKLKKLETEIAELPKEDLEAKYAAEKAWDDGVQAIMSYGLDLLKKKDGSANG